jgi:hypothetical protein
MKLWKSEHVFNHPWDEVVRAALRKYPNPLSPSVVGLDVVNRSVDRETGILRSSRILESIWSVPRWVTTLIGLSNPSYYYEFSEVNPHSQEMKLNSTNLNCTNFVSVDETLVYRPHPENPNKTLLEQSAAITVRGVPLISHLEQLMVSTINANASKGREGLEWVINKIREECDDLTTTIGQECSEIGRRLGSEARDIEQKLETLRTNVSITAAAAEAASSASAAAASKSTF